MCYNNSTDNFYKIPGDYNMKKDNTISFNRDRICVMDHYQDTTPYHSHEFFELVYIREGEISHHLDGKMIPVRAGDYFIIDINMKHKYTKINDKPSHIYNCLFYPEAIDRSMKHCDRFNNMIENYLIKFNISILKYNPTAYVFHDDDGRILSILDRIYNESNIEDYGYTEIIRCALIDILVSTMRKITDYNKTIEKNSPTEYIIKAISKNFNKNITLSEISKSLNYSLPYISSKFKANTGYSFTEYLQKYRIEHSLRLLSNSDMKIIDIAYSVGYNDINFFGELFKKYVNMTPSQFRKASREK